MKNITKPKRTQKTKENTKVHKTKKRKKRNQNLGCALSLTLEKFVSGIPCHILLPASNINNDSPTVTPIMDIINHYGVTYMAMNIFISNYGYIAMVLRHHPFLLIMSASSSVPRYHLYVFKCMYFLCEL